MAIGLACNMVMALAIAAEAEGHDYRVRNPELILNRRPLCTFSEEGLPDWYTVRNSNVTIQAIPSGENSRGGRMEGELSFIAIYEPNSNPRSGGDVITIENPHFGHVFEMLLNDEQFIATGCMGSFSDYVYVADTDTLQTGVGITCFAPTISPNGQYVFFRSQWVRAAPPLAGPCCFALELGSEIPTPFRVYPPASNDIPKQVHFEQVDVSELWFRPPHDAIFECYDSDDNVRRPYSWTVWSPEGDKIAFVAEVLDTSRAVRKRYELNSFS